MALPSQTIHAVQTGGSDTLNGGCFAILATGKATNLTTDTNTGNTDAPVVSSATYNFVAGDVGHWLYVQGGTNWIPGWYQITAVASNKATLNAAVGAVVLRNMRLNTTVGCATVGTPTNGTWAIDYSQTDTVPFSLTGLTTAAANAIILTASATVAMVGNGIQITGGTNFITGIYVITGVVAGVSLTVDRTCTTAAGSAGTAGLGGAFATYTQAALVHVSANTICIKQGTYNMAANATTLINSTTVIGFATIRGDSPKGATRPKLKATANSVTLIVCGAAIRVRVECIAFEGTGQTGVIGISGNGTRCKTRYCKALDCATGFSTTASSLFNCTAQDCTTGFLTCRYIYGCFAQGCTTNFDASLATSCFISRCISSGGGDGFSLGGGHVVVDCDAYGATGDGFVSTTIIHAINCISYGNGGYGFNVDTEANNVIENCYAGSNTSGNCNLDLTIDRQVLDITSLTAIPWEDAANGDFRLNTTTGGGALCRSTGIPGTFNTEDSEPTTSYPDVGAVQHVDPGHVRYPLLAFAGEIYE